MAWYFIKNIINSGTQGGAFGMVFGGGAAATVSQPKSEITPTKETVQEPTVEQPITESGGVTVIQPGEIKRPPTTTIGVPETKPETKKSSTKSKK